jgi:glutamate synthase (NADPH/NADH) large chain
LYCSEKQDHGLQDVLDRRLLELATPALEHQEKVSAQLPIKNTDRTCGTMLSNEITRKYGALGLAAETIHFTFNGTAGQSFGAFCTKGMTLEMEGDANDYFGKGLSGAKLIVYPSKQATFVPEDNIIIGNVALYGATDGAAYIRGKAGERFAVRNSGALAVVEGVGDHGCEYMTGGHVIVLGETGRNFAAGMSGGIAYVYDPNQLLPDRCNKEMVDLDPCDEHDSAFLKTQLEQHVAFTKSNVAHYILGDMENALRHFVKVFPKDYKKALLVKAQQGVKQPMA